MKFLRFRLRSLFIATAVAAIGIAVSRPLKPAISIESLAAVPATEPFTEFPGKYRQFTLTVKNDGSLPLWLTPNESPILDFPWLSFANQGHPTYVELEIDADDCAKLSAGETRVYNLVVHAEFKQFTLGVHARDWRGREGYTHLGFFETANAVSREESDAPESASQAAFTMEDQSRGPGDRLASPEILR
ncbi:MAG: hypothetical protein Rhob2KO_31560 [Rhodopirellula baltica]